MKGSTWIHNHILRDLRLALGNKDWIVLWVRQQGRGILPDGSPITFGVEGGGDLYGILRRKDGVGIHIEIEIKSGQAVQRKSQKLFQKNCIRMGAIYLLCRDIEECIKELEQIRDN